MVTLRIDASELVGFGQAMAGSPAILRSELSTGVRAVAVEGVGIAQGYAPVRDGNLRADISLISSGDLNAEFGPRGIIYARMREYGGTIHGRPWLVFQINGRWVKVRSVTQSGSFYMRRTVDTLRPRFEQAMQAAVDRALARMGL
jgi:hypothetical protein